MTEKLSLCISAMGTDGEGIAKTDGLTCFVPFCLPDEEVEAQVVFKKGNIANCRLLRIKRSVNGRVKPKCRVFGICGGCRLQHASYDLQLKFKHDLVQNNLKKIGGVDFSVLPTVPSEKIYGYRNKLQIPVSVLNGKVVTGFFKRASHDVVPVDDCPLQEDWAKKLCAAVCRYAEENGVSVYDEKTKKGLLRHVVARYVDGQLLAVLVINGKELPHWQKLAAKLDGLFDKFGLFVNFNTTHTNVILGDVTKHLAGLDCIESQCCGVRYRLHPQSFFQVNDDVREKLYAAVAELVSRSGCGVAVDAFSGIGVMSGVLAKNCKTVVGIEIVKQAVADADELKKLNGLENLHNICADVNETLGEICAKYNDEKTVLVVDPPRKGLDKTTREAVLKARPNTIVYVSCDSATLARDVKDLSSAYQLVFCRPFDMFPQTPNVETLAMMKIK